MQSNVLTVLILALGLAACQASDAPVDISSDLQIEEDADSFASMPREFILPSSIVPLDGTEVYFGIDLSRLTVREVVVVQSAWANFQRVLAGKEPECRARFAFTDGGTVMFECDAYDLMRVKSFAGTNERPGYKYGPMLDFLNGNKVERVRFLTYEELRQLEAAPNPSFKSAVPAQLH